MVDSLKVYEILKAGRLPDDHARAMTVAIQAAETERTSDIQAIFRREFDGLERRIRIDLAETKAEMMRWMFIFWVGQMTVTIGLVFAGLKLVK